MIAFSKFLATIKVDVPIKLDMNTLVREEPNEEAPQDFEELEFRTLIDRVLKKTVSPLPSSSSSTSPDQNLCGNFICPTTDHFLPETTLRFKAICLQILRTTGRVMQNSILTRLEMLDVDYPTN